jgi:hypothetical protein
MRTRTWALILVSDRTAYGHDASDERGNMSKRFWVAAVLITASALVAVSGASSAQQTAERSATKAPPILPMPPASDFVRKVDNPYFPLEPGTTFVYRGTKDGLAATTTVEVTRSTKTILGVQAIVVFDQSSVAGQAEEQTFDWYAQDKLGNVWYLGEDSFDFVDGTWVRNDGSWEAGVDGARAGLVMPAHPQVGDFYRQEYYAGHAEDVAEVLSTNASVSVPYGSFDHALQTKDWSLLERRAVEHKHYAPGVGQVSSVMVKGGSEVMELVEVVRSR